MNKQYKIEFSMNIQVLLGSKISHEKEEAFNEAEPDERLRGFVLG